MVKKKNCHSLKYCVIQEIVNSWIWFDISTISAVCTDEQKILIIDELINKKYWLCLSKFLLQPATFLVIFNKENEKTIKAFPKIVHHYKMGAYHTVFRYLHDAGYAAIHKKYVALVRNQLHRFERVQNKKNLLEFINYLPVTINFALFLIDGGKYNMAELVLKCCENVASTYMPLKWYQDNQYNLSTMHLKQLNSAFLVVHNLLFHTYNVFQNPILATTCYTTHSPFFNITINLTTDPSCVVVRQMYFNESAKYCYFMNQFDKAEEYVNRALNALLHHMAIIPTRIIIETLRTAGKIAITKENFKSGKLYIESTLGIYYHLFVCERYSKFNCPIFLECLSDYAMYLLKMDHIWSAYHIAETAYRYLRLLLGGCNLKVTVTYQNYIHICYKKACYKKQGHWMNRNFWPDYDCNILVKNCENLLNKDSLVRSSAQILQAQIKQDQRYCYYAHPDDSEYDEVWVEYEGKYVRKRKLGEDKAFALLEKRYLNIENRIINTHGLYSYKLCPIYNKLGILYLEYFVVGRQRMTRLVKEKHAEAVSLFERALDIEKNVLGPNHHRIRQHEAMYLARSYIIIHPLKPLEPEQWDWLKGIYLRCIDRFTELFGPTHEVLRFCYESLIQIAIITADNDLFDQYENIRDTWEVLAEEATYQERIAPVKNFWQYNCPPDWSLAELAQSDEPIKKLVYKLWISRRFPP